MYLIVGLGNPGKEYDKTRHNVGFVCIDYIATQYSISVKKIKFRALLGEGTIGGEKVILAKPSTYMNLSGESVREMAEYYKVPPENIIVLHDDVSLPVGRMRIREKGSAGGHNGLKSIIYQLSSDNFIRIKIGVGAADEGKMVEHVLGRFSKADGEAVTKCVKLSADAVETVITNGTSQAMNKFNGVGAE